MTERVIFLSQQTQQLANTGFHTAYRNLSTRPVFRILLLLSGLFVHIITWVIYQATSKNKEYEQILRKITKTIKQSSTYTELFERYQIGRASCRVREETWGVEKVARKEQIG